MPHLPPVVAEMVYFGVATYPKVAARWPDHVHAFHQFDVVLVGEVFLEVEGRAPFRLRRGDALLLPPMVRHAHRTRTGFRVGMFKFHAAPRCWPQLGTQPAPVRLDVHALRRVESAGEAWRRKDAWCLEEAGATLTLCLAELVRESRAARPGAAGGHAAFRAQVWTLLERVEANPYRAWSVAGLAAECQLTPDHFTRCFREVLDQGPLEYLLRARMRAAAQELTADPALAIKEVARAAGYANVHAFTRAFARVMGASPARFRRTPAEL